MACHAATTLILELQLAPMKTSYQQVWRGKHRVDALPDALLKRDTCAVTAGNITDTISTR